MDSNTISRMSIEHTLNLVIFSFDELHILRQKLEKALAKKLDSSTREHCVAQLLITKQSIRVIEKQLIELQNALKILENE
jgi:hypothetical protein